jgi:hypothetical protein
MLTVFLLRSMSPLLMLWGVQKAGFNYLLTLDDVVARRHSLDRGGQADWSIGCSGGTGSQDETVCTAAANTINK